MPVPLQAEQVGKSFVFGLPGNSPKPSQAEHSSGSSSLIIKPSHAKLFAPLKVS